MARKKKDDAAGFDIQLRDHVGVMSTALGDVKVAHKQWQIVATNRAIGKPVFVGYAGKFDGAPVNLIAQWPAELEQTLRESIAAAAAKQGVKLSLEPKPSAVSLAEYEEQQQDAAEEDAAE